MARNTYRQLQQQIAALETEAAELRRQEIAGVIEQIRPLIERFGIRPSEIFDRRGRPRPLDAEAAAPAQQPPAD